MDAIKDKLTGFLDGGNADADPVKNEMGAGKEQQDGDQRCD